MAEGRTPWPKVTDEWFVEQPEVTTYLLDRVPLSTRVVWDPACGQGNVLRAAQLAGYSTFGSDIRVRKSPPVFDGFEVRDFLKERVRIPLRWQESILPGRPPLQRQRSIVMNPPYGRGLLTEAFIRRALAISFVSHVCVLVNSKFIWGARRAAGLYAEHAPDVILPISPRPSIPPGEFLLAGGKAEGGVESFAWLVWSPARLGRAQVMWG